MSSGRRIERGEQCDHTEHAVGAHGYVGRYFDQPYNGGEGHWEHCPNEPSYGAEARAEALVAGDPDWMMYTRWDPQGTLRTYQENC